jgi:hypothetical protein
MGKIRKPSNSHQIQHTKHLDVQSTVSLTSGIHKPCKNKINTAIFIWYKTLKNVTVNLAFNYLLWPDLSASFVLNSCMGLHVKDQYGKAMVSNLLAESAASTFWAGRRNSLQWKSQTSSHLKIFRADNNSWTDILCTRKWRAILHFVRIWPILSALWYGRIALSLTYSLTIWCDVKVQQQAGSSLNPWYIKLGADIPSTADQN